MKPIRNVLIALLAGAGAAGAAQLGPAPRLEGEPPPGSFAPPLAKAVVPVPSIDTASRLAVRSAYNTYWNVAMPALGWTGSIGSCNPGTISLAFREWTVSRINFLRAMAGVPGNTVLNTALDARQQASALMMAANNDIDHFPPTSWACYTSEGAAAAAESNLAYGYSDSIPQYMADDGAFNYMVGHRRWILHSRKGSFSLGQVGTFNVLYTFDFSGPASGSAGIYWPPRGYVPMELFFAGYTGQQRWSFGLPGASFAAANVSMTLNGAAVPLNVVSRTDNGYGDNTIVWELQGGHNVVKNTVYDVTITGVSGGPSSTFSYQVRPFDPADPIGAPARTDMNGDARSDILWRNEVTGQVFRMLMNGTSTSNAAVVYTEPNTAWEIVADADFNGDGIADLLWRNAITGQLSMVLFGPAGTPVNALPFYTEANPSWRIVHTPDLNGDGRADILWWNSVTGQVFAMLMNGATITSQGQVYVEPNTQWRIAAVGDLAGSGRQNQLVWRNATTGLVYLMTVNTSGFTQTGTMIYHEPNAAWKILAAPDLNGDGRSDLLWRNDATGQVYVMLMNNGAIGSAAMAYTEPNTAWKIVAQGDYNGDGRSDLLWRNESTGQVYMMLMNGTSISSGAHVYLEPNNAWRILGPWEYGL